MTDRLLDLDGAAWPICVRDCPACGLPSSDGGEHPHCTRARILDSEQMTSVLHLLTAELGATPHRPTNTWRIAAERKRRAAA